MAANGGLMDLILRQARVRGHSKLVDIAVHNGLIAKIAPKITGRPRQVIDCAGKLVSPTFTDIHVHLDAVLTVGQPRFNQSGTLIEGIEIWAERKKTLTFDDVKRRATLAVKWELAHGVTRIRSHVDVCDPQLTAVRALLEVKKEFAGLVDIQLVAFPQDGIYAFPNGERLMEQAMELGCDLVGGIPHHEMTRDDGVADVKFACDLAQQYHRPLDLHIGIVHDSIMDPWYPLGVGDPVQVAFVWIHYGQMSGAREIPKVWDMITTNPARAFGHDCSIKPGKPADFVLLDAETEFDALR